MGIAAVVNETTGTRALDVDCRDRVPVGLAMAIAISRVPSAALASPSATDTSSSMAASSASASSSARPLRTTVRMSSSSSAYNRQRVERLRSGELHTEIRVFRGRSDEDDESLFDRRKQGVLLCTVEPVYLVYEEDRPAAVLAEAFTRCSDRGAHVCDAGADCVESDEFLGAVRCDGESEGRLSRTWWAPQHRRCHAVALDQRAQRSPGRDQVSLADDLVEIAGSQPRGKWSRPLQSGLCRGTEQVVRRSPRARTPDAATGRGHLRRVRREMV